MDNDLKEWLTQEFHRLNQQSDERMANHEEREKLTHAMLVEKLERIGITIYGDDSDSTPGLAKKVDRIETGISLMKYVAGGISVIGGALGSYVHKLFK